MEIKTFKKSEVNIPELAKFIYTSRKQIMEDRGISLNDLIDRLKNEWLFIVYVLAYYEGELIGYALLFQIGDSDLIEINPGGLLGHHPIIASGLDQEIIGSALVKTAQDAVLKEGFNALYIDIPWDPKEPPETYNVFTERYGKLGFEVIQLVRQMRIQLPVKTTETPLPADLKLMQIQEVDEETLYQCHHKAYLAGEAQYYFQMDDDERRDDFERIFAPTIRAHQASLALTQNGNILGYCLLFGEGDFCELMSLAVHPDHRQKGYARLLMQKCLELADDEGHKKMHLIVDVNNKAAASLYSRCGFRDIGGNMTFKWKA